MKFKIGEAVKLVDDIQYGKKYYTEDGSYGDRVTLEMYKKMKGEIAIVTGYTLMGGYTLDKDLFYTYYDEMLESVDGEKEEDYSYNSMVEDFLLTLSQDKILEEIDKALDNGDREAFEKLSKLLV